jgi:RNA polymerase sigma-70 factor (ECF subfamily)
MAFLVALQRMTPAERAVLLLHEVFDFGHEEIAQLVGTSAPASRKLLERARRNLATERRMLAVSVDEHRRLLAAFLRAVSDGDVGALAQLLAADAVMVTDGGTEGRTVEGQRNLSRPLQGAAPIAAFVVATAARVAGRLRIEPRDLNGQPAAILWSADQPFAAVLLGVADARIQRVFFHADLAHLQHLGPVGASP